MSSKQEYSINANLRDLVFGKSGFNFDIAPVEPAAAPVILPLQPAVVEKRVECTTFLRYTPSNTIHFKRIMDLETIGRLWEESKAELTNEYKRKHKSAFKRKLKLKKRF